MEKLERMNILLVGNNPIELSTIEKSIAGFGRGLLKTTSIFDLQSLKSRIKNLKPAGIFIDDKFSINDIKNFIYTLHRNKNTSHIPVTLIKSSNFTNYPNSGADDFMLHTNLSGKGIYQSVLSGSKFRKTLSYLPHFSHPKNTLHQLKNAVLNSFF